MNALRGRVERPEADDVPKTIPLGRKVSAFGPFGPPTIRAPRSQRGFTLLEVLLAFALLALAMGLLLGMLSGGLRQVGDAERETEASLHAQSLLDALGTLDRVEPGVSDGEFADGRYRWTMEITEIEDPAPAGVAAPASVVTPLVGGPQVLRVALDVQWGDGGPRRQLQMVTLRTRMPSEIAAVPQ
jgi:general secretion pathway protein I